MDNSTTQNERKCKKCNIRLSKIKCEFNFCGNCCDGCSVHENKTVVPQKICEKCEDSEDSDWETIESCSKCLKTITYDESHGYIICDETGGRNVECVRCDVCDNFFCGKCTTFNEIFRMCPYEHCYYCYRGICYNNKIKILCDTCFATVSDTLDLIEDNSNSNSDSDSDNDNDNDSDSDNYSNSDFESDIDDTTTKTNKYIFDSMTDENNKIMMDNVQNILNEFNIEYEIIDTIAPELCSMCMTSIVQCETSCGHMFCLKCHLKSYCVFNHLECVLCRVTLSKKIKLLKYGLENYFIKVIVDNNEDECVYMNKKQICEKYDIKMSVLTNILKRKKKEKKIETKMGNITFEYA